MEVKIGVNFECCGLGAEGLAMSHILLWVGYTKM